MNRQECEKIGSDFQDLLRKKEAFDESLQRAIKDGNATEASILRQKIEQALEELRNLIDPFDIRIRENLAKKFNAKYIGAFHVGLAVVKKKIRWDREHWVKKDGKRVDFDLEGNLEVLEFSEGYAWVHHENGNWYLANTDGKPVYTHTGETISQVNKVKEGIAHILTVDQNRKLTHCYLQVETGKLFQVPNNGEGKDFHDGVALVQWSNQRFGYINKKGELIAKDKYPDGFRSASEFCEGVGIVTTELGHQYINNVGQVVVPGSFVHAQDFHEDVAFVVEESASNWCLIDRAGKKVIKDTFERAHHFSEGKALVRKEDESKSFFIDKSGNHLFGKSFTDARDFSEGCAAVEERNNWTFINSDGEYLTDEKFDRVEDFNNGVAVVHRDDVSYLLDKSGNKIPPEGVSSLIANSDEGVWLVNWLYKGNENKEEEYFIDRRGRKIFG